jgi:hypothetical protein
VEAVNSDRAFTAALNEALPVANGVPARVLQLPVMEGRPLPGVPASHHARPYLYNATFSGPAEGIAWQKAVQSQLFRGAEIDREREEIRLHEANAAQAVDEMKAKGFAALYVNRNGYPDGAKGLREMLAKLGYTEVIDSPAGDLMAVVLRKGE